MEFRGKHVGVGSRLFSNKTKLEDSSFSTQTKLKTRWLMMNHRILKVKANSLNSPKLKTVDLTYIRVLHWFRFKSY